MPTIAECLAKIRNAIYGEEVRGSIIDAITQCYTDTENGVTAAAQATQNANAAAQTAINASQTAINASQTAINAAARAPILEPEVRGLLRNINAVRFWPDDPITRTSGSLNVSINGPRVTFDGSDNNYTYRFVKLDYTPTLYRFVYADMESVRAGLSRELLLKAGRTYELSSVEIGGTYSSETAQSTQRNGLYIYDSNNAYVAHAAIGNSMIFSCETDTQCTLFHYSVGAKITYDEYVFEASLRDITDELAAKTDLKKLNVSANSLSDSVKYVSKVLGGTSVQETATTEENGYAVSTGAKLAGLDYANSRRRTVGMIGVSTGDMVTCDPRYTMVPFYYSGYTETLTTSGVDGLYIGRAESYLGHEFTVSEDCNFITIMLARVDELEFDSDEFPSVTVSRKTGDFVQETKLSLDGYEELYMGTIVKAAMAEDGLSEYDWRLTMKNVLALPYGDKTELIVKINNGYKALCRLGKRAYTLDTNRYWLRNGDTIVLPAGANYYRLSIAKENHSTNIDLDELPKAGFHVYYRKRGESDVYSDKYSNVAMLNIGAGSSDMNYRTMPTFTHTSDVHGDYTRVKRFFEYSRRLGVTMACVTGDITAYNIHPDSNHFEWFHDLMSDYSDVPVGVCVGNHDTYMKPDTGNAYVAEESTTYNLFYDPIASAVGNTTGKTWYYTDIAAQNLRIISLNLYEYGGVWTKTFVSQAQLNFLASTLASTPANYGVIILMHAQQKEVVPDASYSDFYQPNRKGNDANYYNAIDNDEDPIGDIVNAFIQKTSINKTYTENEGDVLLTVNTSFANVNSGVEFIAYMTGHFHQDTIGYLSRPDGDPKQLVLNITCGTSIYGGSTYKYLADCSDLPRNSSMSTQDAFNVYAIDRANKVVRVARVGASVATNGSERSYMVIPYASGATVANEKIGNVVTYKPQTLTDEQAKQARSNIQSVGFDMLYAYNFYEVISLGTYSAKTQNGVTFRRNADESWSVNGTASGGAAFMSFINSQNSLPEFIIPGRKYKIHLAIASSPSIPLQIYAYKNGTSMGHTDFSSDGTYTVPDDITGIIIRIYVTSGKTINNQTVKWTMIPDVATSIDNNYTYNETVNKTEQLFSNEYTFNVTPTITTDANGWLQAIDTNTSDETGKTDMTAAIMAMLNSTGYCHLGEGIFYVSGNIDMPSGSTLVGCGRKTILRLLSSVASGYCVKIDSMCTISNLRISGEYSEASKSTEGTRNGLLFVGNDDGQEGSSAYDTARCMLSNVWIGGFTGSGIKCHNTSMSVPNGLYVTNAYISYCWTGINIDYRSEFNKFVNVLTNSCEYGCINNGGNNMFTSCTFGANSVGFYIDGSKYNSGHGTMSSCTFCHIGSNAGSAITMNGVVNGFVVSDCQVWFCSIDITNCTGIVFSGCEFGKGTTGAGATITIDGGNTVMFNGCVFMNDSSYPPSITVTNNTKVKFDGCYGSTTGNAIAAS